MTRRVLEKLCTEKVCADFLGPTCEALATVTALGITTRARCSGHELGGACCTSHLDPSPLKARSSELA